MCDSGELPVGNGVVDDRPPTTIPEYSEETDMTLPWPKPSSASEKTVKTLDYTVSEQEYNDGSSFYATSCPTSQNDNLIKSQSTDDEGAMDLDFPDCVLDENSDINENAMQKINTESSDSYGDSVMPVSRICSSKNNVISTIIEQNDCDSNNVLGKLITFDYFDLYYYDSKTTGDFSLNQQNEFCPHPCTT